MLAIQDQHIVQILTHCAQLTRKLCLVATILLLSVFSFRFDFVCMFAFYAVHGHWRTPQS